MNIPFSVAMSKLRQERGLSQRKAAGDLGISQALLSHYENGLREPRLDFVVKVCDYYGVSADFMLGREKRPASGDLKRLSEGLSELQRLADKILNDSSES